MAKAEPETPFKIASSDSSEMSEIAFLGDLIQAATADYVTNHPDPRHAMAMLMTALPMYAGTLFATLVFMGDIEPKAKARMARSVAHNFRQGIDVGLKRSARVAEETGIFGAKQ